MLAVIGSHLSSNFNIYFTISLVFIYWLYYRKFRRFLFNQVDTIKDGSRPRGKCPPFFPNGWFSLCNSVDLKVREVKYLNHCGRDIVLFRGANKQAYALHAFCAHMGANLGIGGQVKETCIQCPFHGWLFDGETGNCVMTEKLEKKLVEQYEYNDVKKNTKTDGKYLKKCYEGEIKLKKYQIRELNGSILIWFESRDEYHDKPYYEPLDLKTNLDFRGESLNYVNCHIQEIPENGADVRHFDFLHTSPVDFLNFVKFRWQMKSNRANEPQLMEVMKHKIPFINDFKTKTINQFITDENKKYVNVISLDCYLKIFKWEFFFFNATGFQLGPSLVYLFLKSKLFEATFAQSILPLDKFKIKVSHKIFTNSYLPYIVSTGMLMGEVKQLFSDMNIWDNKIFGSKLSYNMKTEADKCLIVWRNWYAQFYEGCYEYEKKRDALEW